MMYVKEIFSGIIVAILATGANAANVVPRGTPTNTNRVSATRPTMAAARMPTMTVNTTAATSVSNADTTTTDDVTLSTPTTADSAPDIVNKSDQFGTGLTSKSESVTDTAAANLAELVRAQRAALDAASVVPSTIQPATGTGENICDTALRECMTDKCGTGFANCAGDTDTIFFDKMDTCRRTTNCTGREYQLFSTEIKADRDFNAKLANYNATIDCGNNYDKCIIEQCGPTYSKCIGKSAGDTAIAKCAGIAKSCTQYDSGLAMRTMGVFADVRQTAERQIAADEKTLYALRDQMRALCGRLGAMFDERSLDCVYTVNFYADKNNTLFASKKAYAGGTFDCTQNWFGIDVTTFRENALRETRAQTAASSAVLGSGVGQLVGAATSGAISRAVNRFNAENALNAAIKDCIENGVDANGNKMTEAACRAKIGSDSQGSTKASNTTKSGTATQLPADIEETLQEIQKGLDQEINDMVIEDSDITAVSPDPIDRENPKMSPIGTAAVAIAQSNPGLVDAVHGATTPNNGAVDEVATDDKKPGTEPEKESEKSGSMKSVSANSKELSISELNENPVNYLKNRGINIDESHIALIKDFIKKSQEKDNNASLVGIKQEFSTRPVLYVIEINYPNLSKNDIDELPVFCDKVQKNICKNYGDKCAISSGTGSITGCELVYKK